MKMLNGNAPSWGFVVALSAMVATLFFVGWSLSLFYKPASARGFAFAEMQRRGMGQLELSEASDYGDRQRFIFKTSDPKSFVDLTARYVDGKWAVEQFNKDFRPWQRIEPVAASH